MKKDIVGVILAAGIGSRYVDEEVPGRIKQFAPIGPVGNEPLIKYSLNQITKTPFSKLIFVVGEKTEVIFRKEFGDSYCGFCGDIPIEYVIQKSHPDFGKPIGTVDAVCAASDNIKDSSFVIFNSDEIFGEGTPRIAYDHLQENENGVTVGFALEDMIDSSLVNRGIFEVGDDNYVKIITEHYGISEKDIREGKLRRRGLCNINLFGFHSNVLPLFKAARKSFLENYDKKKGECILSTELSKLIGRDEIKIKAFLSEDKYHGVTHYSDVDSVRKAIQKEVVFI